MAIGGIGGYGSYFNYQSTINNMRLQQALSKNPGYVQSVQPVKGVNTAGNTFQTDSMEFLRTYSSTMSDVMNSANALRGNNASGVFRDMQVTSSDAQVAEASARYKQRTEKAISLEVTQLAQAQSNVSDSVKSAEKASSDIDFTIQGKNGSTQVQVNTLREDGSTKTNREMLKEAADQINQGQSGVKASIVEKDGTAALQLTAKDTGKEAAFTVSGELGAAKGVDRTSTEAQNAQYSVKTGDVEKSYTSQSNKISIENGQIDVVLKQEGKADIRTAPDADKIASAVSDLLQSYNQAVKYLNGNQNHGSGVESQLKNMIRGLGSEETLKRLGISTSKDGSLVLDKEVMKKSLAEDPGLTKDLISGSYGIAQTAFNRASGAMRANSASLVNYDLQQMEQQDASDPIQFFNLYSRTGAYNMNNYNALGLMMNYLV